MVGLSWLRPLGSIGQRWELLGLIKIKSKSKSGIGLV